MSVVVGVDGGATRARAVVTDGEGRVRGTADGGAALVRAAEPAAVVPGLVALVHAALADASEVPPADALCCALAGVGRERERAAVEDALQREGIATSVRVVTDAEAALHDAFGGGPGIVLIAGTGSVAWGRSPDGRAGRAGGWGALLGDEGGGYAIGLEALRAVLRAEDGRSRATTLTGAVLRATGRERPEELVRWADGAPKDVIAALAPAVFEAAERGDTIAYRILERAAADVADLAAALYRTLGPWDRSPEVAFAGSLIGRDGRLREVVAGALVQTGLPLRILRMDVDAARGAAALAR